MTGAINLYPRLGKVSMNSRLLGRSPSALRISRMYFLRTSGFTKVSGHNAPEVRPAPRPARHVRPDKPTRRNPSALRGLVRYCAIGGDSPYPDGRFEGLHGSSLAPYTAHPESNQETSCCLLLSTSSGVSEDPGLMSTVSVTTIQREQD